MRESQGENPIGKALVLQIKEKPKYINLKCIMSDKRVHQSVGIARQM